MRTAEDSRLLADLHQQVILLSATSRAGPPQRPHTVFGLLLMVSDLIAYVARIEAHSWRVERALHRLSPEVRMRRLQAERFAEVLMRDTAERRARWLSGDFIPSMLMGAACGALIGGTPATALGAIYGAWYGIRP